MPVKSPEGVSKICWTWRAWARQTVRKWWTMSDTADVPGTSNSEYGATFLAGLKRPLKLIEKLLGENLVT